MLGRTHFFIGTAAALAVLQPQTVPVLVTGAGAAAIGSLISDIDVGTSQAHRDADKIITATVAVAALTILAEYKLNLGIYRRLTSDYFAVGFLSHLVLDVMNRKPEKLLWPWKKGFCLGLCSARGVVNRALLGVGMASLTVILVLSAPAGRLLAKIMRAIYG